MIRTDELKYKIEDIRSLAECLRVELTKEDIRSILLLNLGLLRSVPLKIVCLVHGISPKTIYNNGPEKYGFHKRGRDWYMNIFDLPQFESGRVFENGRWGDAPSKRRSLTLTKSQ